MNEPSIFAKIINGEIPSYKIYEDDHTFVFLDIHPIQPGQVLIVPKVQIGFIWDLSDKQYQALMMTVKKVGNRMREVFPDSKRVGVMVEGLDVANHAHVKVFPFSNEGQFRSVPDGTAEPDHEALVTIADKLRFS